MNHPFAELLGLQVKRSKDGVSICILVVNEQLFNPNKVVHGGVIYSLADTGMGAALFPTLEKGKICATIEIKINYHRPVSKGILTCHSNVIHTGKTIANIESRVYNGEKLIATANGNFSIFEPRKK